MENTPVLGCRAQFVVHKLCLKSLLRRHHEEGFGTAGNQTAKESIALRLFGEPVMLNVGKSAESDLVFRY